MKLLAKISAGFDRSVGILAFLGIVLVVFMIFGVSTDVILRYFFSRPIHWMLEVTAYSLLWMTFLGVAWVLKGEGHVKVDLVLKRLNPKTQAMLTIITSLMGAIIFLVITWYGAKVTWEHLQTGYFLSTLLRPPKWPILAIIPIGSFFLFIQFLRRAYAQLDIWRH